MPPPPPHACDEAALQGEASGNTTGWKWGQADPPDLCSQGKARLAGRVLSPVGKDKGRRSCFAFCPGPWAMQMAAGERGSPSTCAEPTSPQDRNPIQRRAHLSDAGPILLLMGPPVYKASFLWGTVAGTAMNSSSNSTRNPDRAGWDVHVLFRSFSFSCLWGGTLSWGQTPAEGRVCVSGRQQGRTVSGKLALYLPQVTTGQRIERVSGE